MSACLPPPCVGSPAWRLLPPLPWSFFAATELGMIPWGRVGRKGGLGSASSLDLRNKGRQAPGCLVNCRRVLCCFGETVHFVCWKNFSLSSPKTESGEKHLWSGVSNLQSPALGPKTWFLPLSFLLAVCLWTSHSPSLSFRVLRGWGGDPVRAFTQCIHVCLLQWGMLSP